MWWSYEDAQKSKARVLREIAKRQKKGERFEVLEAPSGKGKLSSTFWGQAWCKNLEAYQQYESRLPRGRSYLRQGNVYNLVIEPGKLTAVIAGSELYEAQIHIKPLPKAQWQDIVASCAGQVSSMLDLLGGKLGDGMMQVLTDKDRGLFPKPKEIRFDCSCPDFADMCKHVSAVLYGVGVLLDTKPDLLFTLRGVDQAELLSHASSTTMAEIGDGSLTGDLAGTDLSALFGIDLGTAIPLPDLENIPAKPPRASVAKKVSKKDAKPRPSKRSSAQ
ncbi:MAG: SWIM zinc finger family protein [Prosthecobacter sp.]|nr:SWIM zinc finger family protein [Prosthecobacter sp.]